MVERRVRIGVLGLVVLGLAAGAYALTRLTPLVPAAANRKAVTTDVDRYTDLFDLGYRPDSGTGNVAVAATYYYPSLQNALERLTRPSDHQRELASRLQASGANRTALAFYLIIDSVVSQTDLNLAAVLTDRTGRRYPLRQQIKLESFLPQAEGQVRTARLIVFDRTAEDGTPFPGDEAEELTLTVTGWPEPAVRTFRWFLPLLPR